MSNVAAPAINAENSFGFSGVGKATFLVPIYDQKGIAVAQSGAQTIASGPGVLGSIIGLVGLLSGVGAGATQSGCTITVYDAISGAIINTQSGASTFGANTAGIFYQFNFGTTSGLVNGASGQITLPLSPPDLTGINTVFRSGLIACISGGTVGTLGIALAYTKAF